MRADEDEPRFVHGVVARMRQGDSGKKLTTYQLTIVPRPWRLLHRQDCRIFQELTAPEIIKKVLEGAGLINDTDFRLSVQGTYAPREYCVQYRESDWAFISRLMEEEGVYYFFEHLADKHVLTIVDKLSAHAPIAGDSTVKFKPSLGALTRGEHVHRFHYAEEIRSGKVTLRDYDFKKPSLLLESRSEGVSFADLEVYDHPGDYVAPGTGDGLAKIRVEERTSLRKVGEGESACERLIPGYTFTLSEQEREARNRAYLVTRIEHEGAEPAMAEAGAEITRYENRFEVIPDDVPFRPALTTPRPTVKGVQGAVVVGPAGEEIHTDEHGRVKVQFFWDRLGKKDDKSSCWIRVSQVWAGEGWGAMHIPASTRRSSSISSRAIPTGRSSSAASTTAPTSLLRPARQQDAEHDQVQLDPGRRRLNELRFEDKAGGEEVYLHAQKDWTIAVENDKNQTVGHDETLRVSTTAPLTLGTIRTRASGTTRRSRSATIGPNRSATTSESRLATTARSRWERPHRGHRR